MSDDAWKDIPLSPARKIIGFIVFSFFLFGAVISLFAGSELWWMWLVGSFIWGAAAIRRYTRLFDWMDVLH